MNTPQASEQTSVAAPHFGERKTPRGTDGEDDFPHAAGQEFRPQGMSAEGEGASVSGSFTMDPYGPTCSLEYVTEKTGYGRSAIYLRLNPKSRYFDKTFPRQFRMKPWRKVRFLVREVDAWVAAQVESSRNV